MRKIIIIISPLLLITFFTAAQDTINQKPIEILPRKSDYLRMDGRRLSRQQLKEEIYKVPEAITWYKKAKTSKIISYSMAAPLLLFILIGKERDITSPNYNQVKPGILLAEVITASASVYFIINSNKQLKKAVRIRNEKLGFTY